jgi:hypothetical protein
VLRPAARRPAANAGACARPLQVDRSATTAFVLRAVVGEMALVAAPAELGGLQRLVDERVDRPGVDELAGALARLGGLRVAFGNVDDADAEPLGEPRPACAVGGRLGARVASVARDVEQRLLDEVRREPRVRAVRQQRGAADLPGAAQRERRLAQRVVGARRRRERRVGVRAVPGLDRGVEVEQRRARGRSAMSR